MSGREAVTPAVVARIAARPDDEAILRNLEITSAYVGLSQQASTLLGDTDASWTTFGVWASSSVGGVIRNEETDARVLLRMLRRVTSDYDRLAAEVSAAFAEGNRRVFAEIGGAFADFVTTFGRSHDVGSLDAFLQRLPAAPAMVADQPAMPTVGLRDAFRSYHAALGETVAKRRAERILFGNLVAGLVEQVRLQEHLETAFDALPAGVEKRLTAHRSVRWLASALTNRRLFRRLTTELLMRLQLAGEVVWPGRGVPMVRRRWPPQLEALTLPEVRELVAALDPSTARRRGAADDWTNLADRMTFITTLFRARQQAPALFSSPLTDTELDEISGGIVPEPFRSSPPQRRPA